MALQIKNLPTFPYWKYIIGLSSFVILIYLLPSVGNIFSFTYAIIYMGFPAAMLFFALKNIKQHHKTSFRNFTLYLPLFVSVILIFLAEEIWEIYSSFLKQDPFPSIADVFYFLFYPIFMFFIVRSLRPIKKLITKRIIVFGALLSIGLLIPTLVTTYNFNSKEESSALLLLLSYPVLDSILFGIVVIGLLFTLSKSFSYYWIMLFGGVTLWIFADSMFLYATITDTYYDGHPLDALYIISYIMWTFAIIYDTKNANTKRLGYNLFDTDGNYKITFSSLNKFAIPLSWISVIAVSFYIMALLNLFEFKDDKNVAIVGLLLGIIGTMSTIILFVNKNLSQLIQLKEAELQEKNNELRKIEKLSVVGQIAARLAHDLRNPLTAIKMGFSLLTYKQKINQKLSDAEIMAVHRAIFRITHQADDILNYLQGSKVTKNPHSLKNIINSSISYLSSKGGVTFHLPTNDAVINCDSAQIERVFVNILLNSIQAMNDTGNIFIRIHEETGFAKIEFEDAGPGIAEENLDKVFEPLFTTKQKGTGLGLTSCKKIIDNHDGSMTFKNNPTVFTVVLPK
jgi:signal transduction histidine kinase